MAKPLAAVGVESLLGFYPVAKVSGNLDSELLPRSRLGLSSTLTPQALDPQRGISCL